jgi:hypothetical protein
VLDLAEDVASLRSSDASVAIAAVVASDTGRPGVRMQGLRFVMENSTKLEAGGSPYRVQGTGACWMPALPMRILCPSYRIGPDWARLTLAVYAGRPSSRRSSATQSPASAP